MKNKESEKKFNDNDTKNRKADEKVPYRKLREGIRGRPAVGVLRRRLLFRNLRQAYLDRFKKWFVSTLLKPQQMLQYKHRYHRVLLYIVTSMHIGVFRHLLNQKRVQLITR